MSDKILEYENGHAFAESCQCRFCVRCLRPSCQVEDRCTESDREFSVEMNTRLRTERNELAKELLLEKIKRVNEYADAQRIIQWISDSDRKQASTAFTEGPERQIAYAIEDFNQAIQLELKEIKEALDMHCSSNWVDRAEKAEAELTALKEKLAKENK